MKRWNALNGVAFNVLFYSSWYDTRGRASEVHNFTEGAMVDGMDHVFDSAVAWQQHNNNVPDRWRKIMFIQIKD